MAHTDESIVVGAPERPTNSPLSQVKHVIAVGSGKGGVGKSTTATNLAIALSKLGAKVGLMDADIYGPSIPKLVGSDASPVQSADGRVEPIVAHGIKAMSMGFLGGDSPTVWRGPMASKVVTQFLRDVNWGELDYLIVDLPPGTGDIQITLAQAARLSGAVVVMTPQVLASNIAMRGLKMFQQVRVPVIGLVENMSYYECPKCGHHDAIFRSGGGEAVSKELHIPLLGQIPLDPEMVEESDEGTPVVVARPDSKMAQIYFDIAKKMTHELRSVVEGKREGVPVQIVNVEPNAKAKIAKISWNDGKQSLVRFFDLRMLCPCAVCVDEDTGVRKVKPEHIDPEVHPLSIQSVGNYAIKITWSDKHDSGIYSYDYLRRALHPQEA
ncbi:MAG TPA: P-loop NTPase [Bdellovibrionota bacterium]|nr:P-loop NTPase [Bdellovibrionota bacterium]